MTLTNTLPRAAPAPQKTSALSGADDGRRAVSASTSQTDANQKGTVRASARRDVQTDAPRPFSDVLDAQRPTDEPPRGPAVRADGEAGTTTAPGAETAPTGTRLGQVLAQTLAALTGTDGELPMAVASTDPDAEATNAVDDTTDVSTADGDQPLLALLMPTLLPTVMPPAPASLIAGLWVGNADASAEGTASSASSSSGGPALSGAVAADAAQLLSVKAQTGASAAAARSSLPTGDATVLHASDADGSAWAGLQRWSASLMEAPATGAATSVTTSSDHSLAMPANRQEWQQSLMQALGDKLQLQTVQRSELARLHLMPPQLGRIEIDIRQQGGALQVQLVATHDEVRQQLRQIAEPLRQDLVQRHSGEVSVQVAAGAHAAGDGRGRDGAAGGQTPQGQGGGAQREGQRQPGRALTDDERPAAHGFGETLASQGQA